MTHRVLGTPLAALCTLLTACGARTGLSDPPDASLDDVVLLPDRPLARDVQLPLDVPLLPPDVPLVCPAGGVRCGGVCVDTQSNTQHCGACGNVCPSGQVCVERRCQPTPTVGYRPVFNPPGLAYVDVCAIAGRVSLLPDVNDRRADYRIPFAFRYWGVVRSAPFNVNVTTNGWLGLDEGTSIVLRGDIPDPFAPNAVVAPYWRDTVTTASGVCIATVGDAPNRRTLFDWHQVRDLGTSNELSFNVVLHEGSNLIDFAYGALFDAREATVGLENQDGMRATPGCPDATSTCTPQRNTAVRFVPTL